MPKRQPHRPLQKFIDAMPEISGNTVNGLGETSKRQASPFFWHPPKRQTHGDLQTEVIQELQSVPELAAIFSQDPPGGRGPETVDKAPSPLSGTPSEWSARVKAFALANEADLVGIAPMDPSFVYDGYQLADPWVIVVGVGMNYEQLAQTPATRENPIGAEVVGEEYNRASRACRKLANYILEAGFDAKPWPGPYASALNMVPAAIAAGLGELGKHGSIINRTLGSRFRLSAVTTSLPLVADQEDEFGIDDYCSRCNACTRACPPDAIFEQKQLVRGERKWYVDFDRCIPYFGETFGCGICIVHCPWSRPGIADNILAKLKKRQSD